MEPKHTEPRSVKEARVLRRLLARLQHKYKKLANLTRIYEIALSEHDPMPVLRSDNKKLTLTGDTHEIVEALVNGSWRECIPLSINFDHRDNLPVILKNQHGRTMYYVASRWDIRVSMRA